MNVFWVDVFFKILLRKMQKDFLSNENMAILV